jgi:hypothetical protein
MRSFLATLLFILASVTYVWASPNEPIQATISAQLDAFDEDDFERAFTYASPRIQQIFGTTENFASMVQRGYPMVWRKTSVRFLDLTRSGNRYDQVVQIKDLHGAVHFLRYEMIQIGQEWRINGVALLKASDFSV